MKTLVLKIIRVRNACKKYSAGGLAVTLLSLGGCGQPLDLGLHHVDMPGAGDADHPAVMRDASQATPPDTGTVQGMLTKVMTFPDSDAR